MAETFYIKKTNFNDFESDLSIRDENSFIIGPGELNGPTGKGRDSDLFLSGYGRADWGENVNQNTFRLLENNACLKKVNGDYNPLTGAKDYDSSSQPILPKDEYDLGIGNGITKPVVGQLWFNLSDSLLYMCTGFYPDGLPIWTNVVGINQGIDARGYNVINVADPRDPYDTPPSAIAYPNDGVNVNWADLRYVNTTGDTMTGNLVFDTNTIGIDFINDAGTTSSSIYEDYLSLGGETLNIVKKDSLGNISNGIYITSSRTYLLRRTEYETTFSGFSGNELVTADWSNNRFVNVTGDTMTGDLYIDKIAPAISFNHDSNDYGYSRIVFQNQNNDAFTIRSNRQQTELIRTDPDPLVSDTNSIWMLPTYTLFLAPPKYGGTPIDYNDLVNKNYVDSRNNILFRTGEGYSNWTGPGNYYVIVPDGVHTIYITGCSAGQGGQGSGDGGSSPPSGTPGRGGDLVIQSSIETLVVKGGWKGMEYGTPHRGMQDYPEDYHDRRKARVYYTRTWGSRTINHFVLPGAVDKGESGYEVSPGRVAYVRGASGGNSAFGYGGLGTGTGGYYRGEAGFRGGGGASGPAQDGLVGNGGCSGYSIFNMPLRVNPGDNIIMTLGAGSNGGNGTRGDGGKGGDAFIIVTI